MIQSIRTQFTDTSSNLYEKLKEEKTISKLSIKDGESIELYTHLHTINVGANNETKAWVLFCLAKKYFNEKKHYQKSINYIEEAICLYKGEGKCPKCVNFNLCISENDALEYYPLLAEIIIDQEDQEPIINMLTDPARVNRLEIQ